MSELYVGGGWRAGHGDKVLVDKNPFSGETITEIQVADVDDVDEAYRSAAAAQVAWGATNAYQRRDVFLNAARIVQERFDEIAGIICAEKGATPLTAAFEIGLVIDALKEAATLPTRMDGKILPSPVPDTDNYVFRKPVGVIGVISPFNFPFFLTMKPVAPSLATGNGVVIKPHEDTPVTSGALVADIFEAAGLPPGVLNIVPTEIPVIGDAFLEHPAPRVLIFTGSTAVGRHIGEVAARHFKKAILEMGGNNAFIVRADADVDYAVESAVFSRFTHQGQICMSANRVLVHSSIAAEFKQKFTAKVLSLTTGDPTAPGTVIGPLINEREVTSLVSRVDDAIANGARALVRGSVDGNVLGPTVLENVPVDDAVNREELFGPVVMVTEFDTDEEAVSIANDTVFGLSGAIHTRDLMKGVELARQLETGMVHVNDTSIADEPIVPFGGEKQSGLGRLNGLSSIDELTTLQWVSVNHGRRQYPY